MKAPCAECPFRRSIAPGFLGGSPVETFIGQLVRAFWIPCHCSKNYVAKESDPTKVEQCAGAAILRANIKIDHLLPDELHRLPPETEFVFASLAEFWAHHKGVSVAEAQQTLTASAIWNMAERELADARVRRITAVKSPTGGHRP